MTKLTKKLIISDALKKVLKDSNNAIAEKILNTKTTENFPKWINYLDIANDDPTKISYVDSKRFLTYYNKYIGASNIAKLKVGDRVEFKYDIVNTYGLPCDRHGQCIIVTRGVDRCGKIEGHFEGDHGIWWFKENHLNLKKNRQIWNPKLRYMASCGKVVTKMFGQQCGKELSEFCNLFNAYHPNNRFSLDYKIEFVKGDDITYWYHEDQYDSGVGTLGNSCMRYDKCKKFFGLYEKNNIVQMCIVKNKDTNTLIARSLIWDNTYFDRIYATDSKIEEDLRKYLQSLGKLDVFKDRLDVILKVEYGKDDLEYFPYCDTFKYLGNSEISTKDNLYDYIELTDTDGGHDESGIYCEISEEYIDEDDAVYINGTGYVHTNYAVHCNYDSEYYLSDDCVYSDWMGDYILYDNAVTTIDNDYTHEDRAIELHNGKYADENDGSIVKLENGDYAENDDCEYSELNDGYILKEDAHYCDVQEDWVYEYQLKIEENEPA